MAEKVEWNHDHTNPMRIWKQVCQTNPNHTKEATGQGRKVTAINAQSQIQQATELWGPCGDEWSFTKPELSYIGEGHSLTVVVQFDLRFPGGEVPCASAWNLYKWNNSKNDYVLNDDSIKCVITDALTKGLSILGFNADVFLGMFDDNKYVQRMRQLEQEKGKAGKKELAPDPISKKQLEMIDDLRQESRANISSEQLGAVLARDFDGLCLSDLTRVQGAALIKRLEDREAELKDKERAKGDA